MFGSQANRTERPDSDWDLLLTKAEALELDAWDEFCWVLAGGKIDGYYLDSLNAGYCWANSVSYPAIDDPMIVSPQHIEFPEPGIPTGAKKISSEDFLYRVRNES